MRERALAEEVWCAIKHALCMEEHLLESAQKVIRLKNTIEDESKKKELNKIKDELLEMQDAIRAIRQRLVDIAFEIEKYAREVEE